MDWFTTDDYWLARLIVERGIAVIYLVAFLSAANQFRALLGEHGLLPIPRFLRSVSFRQRPSLFHLYYSDRFFAVVAWSGVGLSAVTVLGLTERAPLWAHMLIWTLMWVLYLSIVNVGQVWYSFGWESLLLEAGFIAIFLGNAETAPPILVIFLLRWLVFRLEFGAGLIKMRGDKCWRDLTCLYFHHETQPMPGPLSWFFHHLPRPLHRAEVMGNHVAQLVLPFGLFAPQPVASVCAGLIVITQVWLVASGNFSWLNWLAIVLAFSAIADSVLGAIIPISVEGSVEQPPIWFVVLVLLFFAGFAVLSYWPIRNMLSRQQRMNASFNSLHLVNTYGAFGSVGRVRNEVIIEGTDEPRITDSTQWQEYEFKGKPGDPRRLPRQFAPYHLRLDWLLWFAGISRTYAGTWFRVLIAKLLRNDSGVLRLIRVNPFPSAPPTYIRARLFRYRFTSWREWRDTGAWWDREFLSEFLAPSRLPESDESRKR